MLEIEIEIEYRSDYGKGPTDPESRPASSEKKMLSSWYASRRRNKKNNNRELHALHTIYAVHAHRYMQRADLLAKVNFLIGLGEQPNFEI